MRRVTIVFIGGGLGASLRAVVLAWWTPAGSSIPVLLINLIGAFALGVVYVLADEAGLLQAEGRFFLAVGVLGGFTTFSTFGWGADVLLADHATDTAINYLVASVGAGVAAAVLGLVTGRELAAILARMTIRLPGRLEGWGRRRGGATRTAMDAIEAEDREASA